MASHFQQTLHTTHHSLSVSEPYQMSRHPGRDGSDFRKAAGEVRGESGEPGPAGPEGWVFWIEAEGEVPWCVKGTGRKWQTEKEQPGRLGEPEQWVQELPWRSSG